MADLPPDLLLTYDFPPIGGGISRLMAEMARHYPDRRLVVSTGTVPGSEAADAACPVPVDRVDVPAGRLRTLPGLWTWSRRATDLASRHGSSFSWCGNLRPAAYPARWVRSRLRVPYGIIVYGGDVLTMVDQVRDSVRKRRVARTLLGDADVVVAISAWTRDRVRDLLRVLELTPGPMIEVVPLGTDPGRFHPGPPDDALRTRLGLGGGPLLLTVARLVPHKGVDTAIAAVAGLAARHPGLQYAVAGTGPDRPRLEALAAEHGVADRVRFLGGVDDGDLPGLYRLADLYVGLSREEGREAEGFGIAFVEASATGLPVVAGRSGGVPDAVRDGLTGTLVDPGDAAAAGAAIAALLDGAPGRAEMGRAGRHAVETFYTWERVARVLHGIARAHARPG